MIKRIKKSKYGYLEGKAWNELFQTEIEVYISSQEKLDYAHRCADYFSDMSDEVVDRICTYCIRYCEDMRKDLEEEDMPVPVGIKGREILAYIRPSLLIVEDECDEDRIEFHVECGCDWEEEHGLEITISDGKILYVGPYDDMPPYAKGRLEYAGYYNEENAALNMNYADDETASCRFQCDTD